MGSFERTSRRRMRDNAEEVFQDVIWSIYGMPLRRRLYIAWCILTRGR